MIFHWTPAERVLKFPRMTDDPVLHLDRASLGPLAVSSVDYTGAT